MCTCPPRLSDVIEEFLRQHGALSENVVICSNRLNYDADVAPKSVSPDPPITSFTKEYGSLVSNPKPGPTPSPGPSPSPSPDTPAPTLALILAPALTPSLNP